MLDFDDGNYLTVLFQQQITSRALLGAVKPGLDIVAQVIDDLLYYKPFPGSTHLHVIQQRLIGVEAQQAV